MRRAIEFEIRLSYHDRILKTLPPVMQEEDAHVIPPQAPGPDFEYEEPSKSWASIHGGIHVDRALFNTQRAYTMTPHNPCLTFSVDGQKRMKSLPILTR
jgi:hypothetical protein